MVAFPIAADGADPILDVIAYLTNILEAQNEGEQRICIRNRPRRALEYSIVCSSPRAASFGTTLIRGRQAMLTGVPFWHYANPLTAAASGGAGALLVSTADIPWQTGDSALIWTDPWTVEIVTVSSAVSGQLNLTGVTTLAWPVGALVMPIGDGRIAPEAAVSYPSLESDKARLRFQLDPSSPVLAIAASAGGATYAGFDVLDGEQLSRNEPIGETLSRKLILFDNQVGPISVTASAVAPRSAKSLRWKTGNRAEARVLRNFLESRKGRLVPFWVPSVQADFSLATALSISGATVTVDYVGYTENIWPMGRAGRHVALYTPGSGFEYRKVTGATHTPGAATEVLTLDTGVARAYPVGQAAMLLKLCRLDSDENTMAWRNQRAESTMPLRELPLEEPL